MELRDVNSTDEGSIRSTLAAEGWSQDQIEGQLAAVRALSASEMGFVAVADDEGSFSGFVSAQFYGWNGLAQIHGLAVASQRKRRGIASRLIGKAEEFARSLGARGVYIDTPVDNKAARAFYTAVGYSEAYRMPRYYTDELDGVAFAKFFN